MLFAAGMGIGLMFFGVLEPVYHFQNPPLGIDAANIDAAREIGMSATIFHWALHPWAIYAVVALALAYFHYNMGLPLTIRSAFYPLFGERVWGWLGHVIDTLAVFATLFGLATSLGLGAEQALAGLNHLFGVPVTDVAKILLILGITAIAVVSVVMGIDAGVKRLSEINMALALCLLIFVILAGPTAEIIKGIFVNKFDYVKNLPNLSNWVGRDDTKFMHGWTTFYWAWWIAWSPFVGMFIARVSRGRTVREFIICVLIIPSVVGVIWMTAFGGTALSQFINNGYTGVTETVSAWKPELSLYKMLEPLPLAGIFILHRCCAGHRVLRHVVGLWLPGDRYDHRGRQGRRAGRTARVLGDLRRFGGDHPADWRWPHGLAGRVDLDRPAIRNRTRPDVRQRLHGVAGVNQIAQPEVCP